MIRVGDLLHIGHPKVGKVPNIRVPVFPQNLLSVLILSSLASDSGGGVKVKAYQYCESGLI